MAAPSHAENLERGKDVTVDAVRPNVGVEAAYRGKLETLIDEMQRSIVYWLSAAYRANEPELAQDASPAAVLRKTMRGLTRKWQTRFDEAASDYAENFANSAKRRADGAFKESLKKKGFTVEFKMTPAINDAYQAVIGENIGLIKSIASEHLSDVEGAVMRSVQRGRDLGTLSQELQARHGVTRRRAAFIARDQNNKATSVITAARQIELGIKATWLHSAGGTHPRPEHVAASGKAYDPQKGMFLEGKWVWPGSEPNCRCVSKSVVPGFS